MSTEQLHTTPQPSVENTEPTNEKKKKRSKKGLYTGLGVGAASTALAVSLFAGFSNSNNGEAAPEPGQPVPTDIAEPNEPEVDGQSPEAEFTEADLTVEGLEIPAGLSAEEFAQTLTERNLAVWKPLQNDEFFDYVLTEFGNGTPVEETIREKANELADIFHESTFTEEALDRSTVQNYIEIRDSVIFASLQGWFLTYESGNPEDIEPYDAGVNLISATEISKSDNGDRELEMVTQQYDNRDLNRMGTQYVNGIGGEVNFSPLTYKISTSVVDGVEKISNIEILGSN